MASFKHVLALVVLLGFDVAVRSATTKVPRLTTEAAAVTTEDVRQPRQECRPSITTKNGKKTCKEQLIFEDNFENSLDETTWKKDVLISNGPDYEFVLYDSNPRNCFVKNGILHLKPKFIDTSNNYLTTGQLDLRKRGCTGNTPNECYQKASSFNVLPPITSARIKTKQTFSFQYGVVEIRAKLPEGNWLIPEMWLDPVEQFYGPDYSSGRMWIAMSRGNPELITPDGEDIGAKMLRAGMILSEELPARYQETVTKVQEENPWNDAFHKYRIIWSPEGLVMSVDGVNYGARNAIPYSGFRNIVYNERWSEGTDLAPFDREFYITLGLGVGGIRDFPDNSTTGGIAKPWRNAGAKAKLDFWKARRDWEYSWGWDNDALQVDYVKVWAL